MKRMSWLLCLLLLLPGWALADKYSFSGVNRIVAIGDQHGDYEQFCDTLEQAGIIDHKGRWIGGRAHLVQTGDVVDRGADSRKIIDHLRKLAEQAEDAGGAVHTLVGNHEAMNLYGDLRYTHPGEYEAFTTRWSATSQEKLYEYFSEKERDRLGDAAPEEFDAAHRAAFDKTYPVGWIEHQQAWAPKGEYGQWVLDNPVIIRVNDILFLHGGISERFADVSMKDINKDARKEMNGKVPPDDGVLRSEDGPLWYRGLAEPESPEIAALVDQILANFEVNHIVLGHSVTSGAIEPRYDGKVLLIDTGASAYYGGHNAWLDVQGGELKAGYPGGVLAIPGPGDSMLDYLQQVLALEPGNERLQKRIAELQNPTETATAEVVPD